MYKIPDEDMKQILHYIHDNLEPLEYNILVELIEKYHTLMEDDGNIKPGRVRIRCKKK